MKSKIKSVRKLITELATSNAIEPRAMAKVIQSLDQLEHSIVVKDIKQIEKSIEYFAKTLVEEVKD